MATVLVTVITTIMVTTAPIITAIMGPVFMVASMAVTGMPFIITVDLTMVSAIEGSRAMADFRGDLPAGAGLPMGVVEDLLAVEGDTGALAAMVAVTAVAVTGGKPLGSSA